MPTDGNLLNSVLQAFTTQLQAWYPLVLLYGVRLLGVLAFVQLAFIAVDLAATHDASGIVDSITAAVIRLGLVYVILNHAQDWGEAVINTGLAVGQAVSGQSPKVLTPSGVFQMGLNMAGTLLGAKAKGGWLNPIEDAEMFFTVIVVVLAWAAAAFIYLGTLLEAAWVIFVGPILICFSALSSTAPMLVRWATSVLGIALKTAVLILVLAIGMGLAQDWGNQLNSNAASIMTNLWWLVLSIVQSILFFYFVLKVPGAIVTLVAGTMFSFGEAFASAVGGAVSAAGLAAAGAGVSAASSVASGAGGLGQVSQLILFGDNGGSGGGAAASSNAPTGPLAANAAAQRPS